MLIVEHLTVEFFFIYMQKIAIKLSIQISKETSDIKRLLQEYNTCLMCTQEPSATPLSLDVALDPSILSAQKKCDSIFSGPKQDIVEASLLLKRSNEEIELLEGEMKNTCQHYERKKSTITTELQKLQQKAGPFERGAIALLHTKLLEVDRYLDDCRKLTAIVQDCTLFALANESDDDS